MKKLTILTALLICGYSYSQDTATLNKFVTGVQIGFIGADIYNEARISDNISLRTQISLNPSIWGGDAYSETGFALAPSISVAPKFYYNFEKRAGKGYNTKNNAANYFSVKLEYMPDWFVISNAKNIHVNEMVSLVPNWGLRRNFASNFNYELRLGLGIGKILKEGYDLQAIPDISFKVGYDF
jgi:hypothetical protein